MVEIIAIKDKSLEDTASRDLFLLIDLLNRSNLLHDIDEDINYSNLRNVLLNISVHSDIPTVINACYSSDERLKKAAILQEWLENCAVDKIIEIPVITNEPWGNTTIKLLNKPDACNIKSIHPDGQLNLTNDGLYLNKLEGNDNYDQEILLQAIYQLIRAGQLKKAQELAVNHQMYWLAGTLLGGTEYHYEPIDENSNSNKLICYGNIRKPVWMRTCWKYAKKLSDNPNNFPYGQSVSSNKSIVTYEMTIYAILSSNIKVLDKSSLISSNWSDKLWATVKCIHSNNLLSVLKAFKDRKIQYSELFEDCDSGIMSALEEILNELNNEIGHISIGDCVDLFNRVPPPSPVTVEALIYRLQSSFIGGKAAIDRYIHDYMVPIFLDVLDSKQLISSSNILHLYCHVLLWLKYESSTYSLINGENFIISDLVSDDTLYLGLQRYINLLCDRNQYGLITPYIRYMNKPRRIQTYSLVLHKLTSTLPLNLPKLNILSNELLLVNELIAQGHSYLFDDMIDTFIHINLLDDKSYESVNPTNNTSSYNIKTPVKYITNRTPMKTIDRTINKSVNRQYENTSYSISQTPKQLHNLIDNITNNLNSYHIFLNDKVLSDNYLIIQSIGESNLFIIQRLLWLSIYPMNTEVSLLYYQLINHSILQFYYTTNYNNIILIKIMLLIYVSNYSTGLQNFLNSSNTLITNNHTILINESDSEMDSNLIESINFEKDQLSSYNDMLLFWYIFIQAIESVLLFKDNVKQFRKALDLTIGSDEILRNSLVRHGIKLEQSARQSTDLLMKCLVIDNLSNGNVESNSHGITQIWIQSYQISLYQCIRLLNSIESIVLSITSSNDITDQVKESSIDNQLIDNMNTFKQLLNQISNNTFDKRLNTNIKEIYSSNFMNQTTNHLVMLLELSNTVTNNIETYITIFDVDKISTINSKIVLCITILRDMLLYVDITSNISFVILSQYLQVCIETGYYLEKIANFQRSSNQLLLSSPSLTTPNIKSISRFDGNIDTSTNNQEWLDRTQSWYVKGSKLADVIASDDKALQLHKVLKKDDLESLLQGINNTVMKSTSINKPVTASSYKTPNM